MKHTKREWMPLYSFLDRKRVTDHLADMAARGWMLDRLGTWSWHYRRTEPKQLRFAVTFFAGAGRFSPAPAAGLDTFQDYCAQAGWHRAASSDQVQVFYSEDPAAVPIDTDPAAELENIRRSIGKPMIRNYLALLLLCLLEVAFQCYQIWTDPVDTLASPTALLAATAYLPLLVLTLASLLLYRRWQWRAEAAVEAGLPLPDLRSARGLGILVLMWSGLLIAGLFASISRSTGMVILTIGMVLFFALVYFLANAARKALQRLRCPPWANLLVIVGICIAMFAGLSSPEKLCIMVLHALGQGVPGCKAGPQLVQYLAEQSCLPTEQTPITTRTQLVEALAGGMAVLLVEGSGQALAFSTQDMPGRSVTNPSGEGNMRGPQDAFTEHLRNNISQLRRQFRTGSFTAEICTANTRAKTEYAICYDTALAPADVVQTLKQRLAGVQIPVLLDSTYFASFLKQDKLNLFPAAAYTERPATACARICEGKIVILVSGSPLAMVVPSFFAEHFECLDDYSSGAVFAGLIRLLKYLAFLLAVFGPGLYVMAVSFAPELIPVHLLAKLAQGEASTPLPPMPEMLAVTLLLEIVREAGLRAPKSISHTVSLVGALIIGETAVSAGIISVPVLTMAAAATIATLAVPALYEQSILFRFAVILLAGLFGVPGLACGALLILAMACGSDPFGYDYLYPLMPPGKAALRDGFVRAIWSRLAQKGEVLPRHAKE